MPADAAKHATEAKEASRAFTVVRMDVGANDKLGRKMLDAMKKANAEGSFMIISADPDKKAVGSYAVASEAAMAKGVDAREWVNAALAGMGSKGGGKDGAMGMGQAKKVLEGMEDKVGAALADANAFIAKFA